MSEIFISWSKERSRRLAGALFKLIETQVGPHVVWSPDLPKGASWFGNLAGKLEGARAGILCITPENRDSPWLLFEAGALIRCDYEVALFPVLLDVSPSSLQGPLSLVQSTTLLRDPVSIRREIGDLLQRVVAHVNVYGTTLPVPALPSPEAALVDDLPWQELTTEVLTIDPPSVTSLFPGFGDLFRRKTFEEPFEECADQRWLERYAAARLARAEMAVKKAEIDKALPPGAQLAYDGLFSAVDGYAMAIAGLLLEEHEYRRRDSDGRLEDSRGELAICEQRRRQVEAAFRRLDDPTPPVFDESRLYEELPSLEERKRRLIHPLERRLEEKAAEGHADPDPFDRWQRERARTSPWLYDRIVFYLCCAYDPRAEAFDGLAAGIEFEISRLESLDEPDTLVGLYYGLESAERSLKRGGSQTLGSDLLGRIEEAIDIWNTAAGGAAPESASPSAERWDTNRKVRRLVERLRRSVPQTKRRSSPRRKPTTKKRRKAKKSSR